MTPRLSVVIPAYNVGRTLPLTLACLDAQDLAREDFECIFVDDASTDDTSERIESWRTTIRFRLLRNERNRGRSLARNRGVDAASGDVLVFLDGDMFVSPAHLRCYQDRFARGDVDVVSGRRWCLDVRRTARFPELEGLDVSALPGDRIFSALRPQCTLGQTPEPVKEALEREVELVCAQTSLALTRALAFITSNVAVSRSAFAGTTGFSRWLRRAEDTDLGIQLARRGARFAYLREAEAIHPFFALPKEEVQEAWPILFLRHPYTVLLLWVAWSWRHEGGPTVPELAGASSLVDIATIETSRKIRSLDADSLGRRLAPGAFPFSFDSTVCELVSHFAKTLGVPEAEVAAQIERGLGDGLMAGRRRGETYLDPKLIEGWLDRGSDLRQRAFEHSFFRHHKTPRQLGNREEPPRLARWRGRYELCVPEEALPVGTNDIRAVLPLPVQNRHQSEVRFEEWWPANALDYRQEGVVFACPLPRGESSRGDVTLGYRFSCTVEEWSDAGAAVPGTDVPEAHHLRPSVPDSEVPRLLSLLAEVGVQSGSSAVEKAHSLYRFLLEEAVYHPNRLPDYSTAITGIGECHQFSRLFANLCRLSGVPAREACGALAGRRQDHRRAVLDQWFTPFAHTWVEIWSDSQGWVPIELYGMAHGARVFTGANFPDAALREEFLGEGPICEEYYFGGLDPFRIHTTPWASQLPSLIVRRDGEWVAFHDEGLRIRHRLELTLCDLSVADR